MPPETKTDPKAPSLVLKVTLKGDRPRALSRELWNTFDRRLTNHIMDQERDDTPPPGLFRVSELLQGYGAPMCQDHGAEGPSYKHWCPRFESPTTSFRPGLEKRFSMTI